MAEVPDFDLGTLQRMMELSQATFRCLRSGECCNGFEVVLVPGYNRNGDWTGNLEERGRKPAMQPCRHLEPARVVEGKWQQAACKIHDDPTLFPDECRKFTFGFGSCALGLAIWNHRKGTNPTAALPEDAQAALDSSASSSGPRVQIIELNPKREGE